jgi:hypothetical protein
MVFSGALANLPAKVDLRIRRGELNVGPRPFACGAIHAALVGADAGPDRRSAKPAVRLLGKHSMQTVNRLVSPQIKALNIMVVDD